jgi:hypothetical protein
LAACSRSRPRTSTFIGFHQGFFLAVLYREGARSAAPLHSIWPESRSSEPAELQRKIVDFGVTQFDFPFADHLSSRAPRGLLFRLVRNGDDLSPFKVRSRP